jgi:two-component system OmpR family response regulator
LARVDRVVRRLKRPPSESQTMLRGDVEHVPLASVLSLLELEKKTGILRVVSTSTARFHIARGAVLKVEIEGHPGGRSSRDALKQALEWTGGQFEFCVSEVNCDNEIRSSVTSILLDIACSADEAERDELRFIGDEPREKRTAYEEPPDPDDLDWDPSTP